MNVFKVFTKMNDKLSFGFGLGLQVISMIVPVYTN